MPTIRVRRFDGTKEGDPIIEILAADEAALMQRGRNALDDSATDKQEITQEIPYAPDLELLDLAAVLNYSDGSEVRGRVTNISHSFSLPEAITTLTIEAVA
ncbi:hypothetical protein R21Y_71 [Vibrio phage vB_VhaS_R21Y]|nr:hypothetical protein R21Y_71 [Vibrio phage vB_VhaS_R21Y]